MLTKTRLLTFYTPFSLAGAVLLAACGSGSPAPAATTATAAPAVPAEAQKFADLKGNAENGKTKFAGTCVSCHGPDAKGMPGLGKDLTTSEFLKKLSDPEAALFWRKAGRLMIP